MIIYKKKKMIVHFSQKEYKNYEKFVSNILKNRHGMAVVKSNKERHKLDIDYIRSMLKWDNTNFNEIIDYKFEHFKNSKDVILIIKYYTTKKIIGNKFHDEMMKNYK